jgi:hypothetical protein
MAKAANRFVMSCFRAATFMLLECSAPFEGG